MTDEAMLRAVYQAVVGIPGTADEGMVGDFKALKAHIEEQKVAQQTLDADQYNKINKNTRLIIILMTLAGLGGGAVGIFG